MIRRPVPTRSAAVLGGALAFSLAAQPGAAQQPGGVVLGFTLSQRFEATENLGLDPVSAGTTWRSDTRLGFSVSSETRRDSLSARLSGALRAVDAPDPADDESFGFADPDIALSYLRRGATAQFQLDATLTSREIAFLSLADLVGSDGGPILPEDLEDLTGTGTRRQARVSAALRGGEGTPFGYGLRAAYTRIDYIDVTATNLFDSERLDLGADTRFDFAPDRRLTLALGYSLFDDDDPTSGERETLSLDTGIEVDRPLGTVSLDLGIDRIEEGTRTALTAGLNRAVPWGGVDVALGVSRSAGGNTALIGEAGVSRDLPRGTLGARLRRSYTAGSDDTESLVTSVTANWAHQLTPLSGLSLDIAYVDSRDSATDQSLVSATAGVTWSYTLTPDWSLDLGYRRRYRNDESVGTGWVSSDAVFLGVGRSFSGGY